jgi:hypothetical protein
MFEIGQSNIKNLLTMDNQALDPKNPQTKQYLATLKSLKNKYNVDLVQATLEETRRSLASELESTESIWDAGTRMTKDFFRHRGLNLLITVNLPRGRERFWSRPTVSWFSCCASSPVWSHCIF